MKDTRYRFVKNLMKSHMHRQLTTSVFQIFKSMKIIEF